MDSFAAADERTGGGTGRTALAEFLATDMATYLRGRFTEESVRRDMFDVAAEMAVLAGWMSHDTGHEGLAQRYYLHAWRLAQESDPRAHAAWVLRLMAHQAIDTGHGRHCVDLADAAVAGARGRVDPATEMLLWLALARARAECGDRADTLAAIARAESLPLYGGEQPARWAARAGNHQALLASHTAKALRSLGDGAALDHMWRSVQFWPAHTHPRIRGLNTIAAGQLQIRRGRVDDACTTWHNALGLLHGINSARVHDAVVGIRSSLAPYRQRGVRPAVELDQHAITLLSP